MDPCVTLPDGARCTSRGVRSARSEGARNGESACPMPQPGPGVL